MTTVKRAVLALVVASALTLGATTAALAVGATVTTETTGQGADTTVTGEDCTGVRTGAAGWQLTLSGSTAGGSVTPDYTCGLAPPGL